jgi:hypothetical protein
LTGQQKVNKRQQQLQPQCIHPPEDSAVVVVGARKKKKKRGERKRLLVRWPGKLAAAAFQTLSHSTLTTRPFWTQQKKKERKKDCLARTRLALFLSASSPAS